MVLLNGKKTFPGHDSSDPVTGKTYSSSSIASRPLVVDIEDDGNYEIIVSVGVDLDFIKPGTSSDVYSPGHKGGVYAINALTAETLWFKESKDTIGGDNNTGDGLSDGVIASPPIACDLNNDGTKEVIWGGSWDQHIYAVNGTDGSLFGAAAGSKWPVNQHDTIWSSATCADINNDGLYEILIGGDITENEEALTQTGGVFHVYDRWGGREIIDGFNNYIKFDENSNDYSFIKGKYEEQTIWSTPEVADLDNDGKLEIAYGTGLYKVEPSGNYIKIWNNDGTEYLKLTTNGRTFAKPIFADINNDGNLEIIATTVTGWVHAWTNTGTALFATQTFPSGGGSGQDHPIYSTPLTIDIDKDNDLEIIYQQGVSLIVVSHDGTQLTNPLKWGGLKNEYFRGTPSISDLDNDGNLEIITGGTNEARDTGVLYVYNYGSVNNSQSGFKYGNKEFHNPGVVDLSSSQINRKTQISNFVTRFYTEVLNRTPPDSWGGLSDWTSRLMEGDKSGADVARGFVLSTEFVNSNKTTDEFLNILYAAFFNRDADSNGFNDWKSKLSNNSYTRSDVLDGFLGAQEFINLSNSYNISPQFTQTQGLTRILVEEFVTRLYNQVLQREPDAGGLAAWTDALMKKRTNWRLNSRRLCI